MENKEHQKQNENIELNGWQNLGKLQKYATKRALSPIEKAVYMIIGEYSLGLCQSIALPENEKDKLFTIGEWATSAKVSVSTFKRTITKLIDQDLITKHRGSHFRVNGGSYPDTYSINFQKEDKLYFNIDGVRMSDFSKKKANTEPQEESIYSGSEEANERLKNIVF